MLYKNKYSFWYTFLTNKTINKYYYNKLKKTFQNDETKCNIFKNMNVKNAR